MPVQRARPANDEIGPVAGRNYEIWNCTIFVIKKFRGKSKHSRYTKHSLFIINLHEQRAHRFVKFFDLAKNWHF